MNIRGSIKCVSVAYVERDIAVGGLTWAVYNRITGHIVALLHSEGIARRLAVSMNSADSCYTDGYDCCELWRDK
jgi:hypothetical protein